MFKYYKKNDGRNLKGQVDTQASKLNDFDATSGYGQTNAAEFFAEAFSDVYSHGENARPASIELVKLYEEMRDKMEKKNKGRRGWLDFIR